MKCMEFECRLAELMGGDFEGDDRNDRIVELRSHARGCSECAATLDLLELLGSPAGARDIVDDPGDAYWSAFDDRLRTRIRESPERRISLMVLGSAAAAAVVLFVAGWAWIENASRRESPNETAPIPFDLARDAAIEIDPIEFPDDLNDLLLRTAPEDVEDAAGFVGMEMWPEELLVESLEFDDAYDAVLARLPSASRTETLERYREFEVAWGDGLDDLSASARESAGLYPDLSELDSSVRVKLLEWLNSQTGA